MPLESPPKLVNWTPFLLRMLMTSWVSASFSLRIYCFWRRGQQLLQATGREQQQPSKGVQCIGVISFGQQKFIIWDFYHPIIMVKPYWLFKFNVFCISQYLIVFQLLNSFKSIHNINRQLIILIVWVITIVKSLQFLFVQELGLNSFYHQPIMNTHLLRRTAYQFRAITPQDYLINQRQAGLTKRAHIKTLLPLDKNNHGEELISDEIKLVGVPKGQNYERFPNFDTFQQLLTQGEKDLIFLQIDPSAYVARQRFMSHRCAMGEVQDYRKDGVRLIDPHRPITWQQTVVNLLTLDLVRENKLPGQLDYKKGLYAYSYPYVQEPQHSKAITNTFINEISSKILQGRRTGYNMIEKVLYTSLMGKHKVMLGGMPETLCRMILGKALSIHEARDIFRLVMEKNKMLTIPFGSKAACENFLPHIFNLPKDLYMTAMLKESFQAAMQMVALVGIQSWRPIQQYWIPPPYGINMTQATRIPQGFAGETVENLIQKQAIYDVLLQTRTWSKGYLSNPFPYLFEDITKVDPKQLEHFKKTFLKYYKQYSEFKRRQLKQLPEGERQRLLSLMNNSKKQQEQFAKAIEGKEGGQQGDFALKHLKRRMNLNMQKSIKIEATK